MIYKFSWLLVCISTMLVVYAPVDPKQIPELLKAKENLIHVAIIGSGPAGYSAAIPPARAGYRTVVFQGPKPGGELMDSALVENWPGFPREAGAVSMSKLEKQATQFGALLDPATISSIDFSNWPFKLTTNTDATMYALTVIIATGASQKKLGIENEDIYWGHGLFSCGICDGAFTQDKDACVIGGGDIAIQRALQVAQQAKNISLIVPGPKLTATESMQKKIRCHKNIHVITNKEVKKIDGDGTNITHVVLQDTLNGEISNFDTQAVFLSTGLTPNTDLVKGKLELDKHGCIKLKDGRTQETSVEGVLAAGNVADWRYRQVACVMGDATKAAIDALRFLSNWGFDGLYRDIIQDRMYKPVPMADIKHIRSIPEFLSTIAQEVDPVLVEFYSPHCSHCKNMEPRISAVSEKFKDVLKVFKVNKDKLFKLTQLHKIQIIPAFILFIEGKPVHRLEGEVDQEKLFEFVENSCDLCKDEVEE